MASDKSILLVDDDMVDVMTVKRAFKQIHVNNRVEVKGDGEEALEYLRNAAELPGVILLDLNMPRMNGKEFLTEIKSDEQLKSVPVIVLSTSGENSDIRECFASSIVAYIVKPVDYQDFVDDLRKFDMFWTTEDQAGIEKQ